MMKIGVFYPSRLPFSARNYIENITKELEHSGVVIVFFKEDDPLPNEVDIYWDPRVMGGGVPYKKIALNTEKPLIITLHGTAPFALPAHEFFPNLKSAIIGKLNNLKKLFKWRRFRNRCDAIITVSSYAKWEIQKYLGLYGDRIFPIYHGVDLKTFVPKDNPNQDCSYLLHISQYQPIKNVIRIFEAYTKLTVRDKPRMIAVVPGFPKKNTPMGIEIIRTPLKHNQLVPLYQGAIAFVFPSLRESFGMPILEAMACGCPVITSNATGCFEVAGDAGLLVNPRSVEDITDAMRRLIEDEQLRKELRDKGLKRVRQFTWHRSAQQHLEVFEKVLYKRG